MFLNHREQSDCVNPYLCECSKLWLVFNDSVHSAELTANIVVAINIELCNVYFSFLPQKRHRVNVVMLLLKVYIGRM